MDFGFFTIEDRTWSAATLIAFMSAGAGIGWVVFQLLTGGSQ